MSVPTVKEINSMLPVFFLDNGPSSPFRGLHKVLYGKHGIDILGEAARAHDAGYSVLRLFGSGYDKVTRKEWDQMYRNHIAANGHPVAARIQYIGLRMGGGAAWKKIWRNTLRKYSSYQEYLGYKQDKPKPVSIKSYCPFYGFKREIRERNYRK